MPRRLNHEVGMSQPEVEPTSANETRLPLAPSGQLVTSPGLHTTIAW
jgi:hypothetical protein